MLVSKFNNQGIEGFIKEFEEKHNIKFPEQYAVFLTKYNGGETPKTDFKINKVSSDIRGFYGLGNANKYFNFQNKENTGVLQSFISEEMLPIGENGFGDYILIGIGKESQGKVYFCYHDKPRKYIELSNSFSIFIEKCKSKKIGYVESIEERTEYMIENGFQDRINKRLLEIWQTEIDKYANIQQEKLILNDSDYLER